MDKMKVNSFIAVINDKAFQNFTRCTQLHAATTGRQSEFRHDKNVTGLIQPQYGKPI
jgi:hypothetical protein